MTVAESICDRRERSHWPKIASAAKTKRIASIHFNPLPGARVGIGARSGGSGKSMAKYRARSEGRKLSLISPDGGHQLHPSLFDLVADKDRACRRAGRLWKNRSARRRRL